MREFGKAKGGGRRSAARVKAPVLARLSTVTEDYRAILQDISGTGAQLSATQLPPDQADVIFRADTVQCFGRVAWSKDGQCGVAFESPLYPAEVDRLRWLANIWNHATMTPEERAAAEEWKLGCGR
jgi:hypothetical protein